LIDFCQLAEANCNEIGNASIQFGFVSWRSIVFNFFSIANIIYCRQLQLTVLNEAELALAKKAPVSSLHQSLFSSALIFS